MPGRPTVWANDVAGKCIITTSTNDSADVRAALAFAGLHVQSESPTDSRPNNHQFVVVTKDGPPVTAEKARALLKTNEDIEVADA